MIVRGRCGEAAAPSDLAPLFEPTVRRVLAAEEFLRELGHLVVEDWLKNARVEPYLREMLSEAARRRAEYLYSLHRQQRKDLHIVQEDMLEAHPDLSDPAKFTNFRGKPHTDFSPARFEELLSKDDMSCEEYHPAVRYYDDPYDSEVSVEGYLVKILDEWVHALRRQDPTWEAAKGGQSAALEKAFKDSLSRYLSAVRRQVDWRFVAPEAAMCDLCLLLQGLNDDRELDRLGLDAEDVWDSRAESQVMSFLYQLLYEPRVLDTEQERRALKEIAYTKRRLEQAWDGLRAHFASSLAILRVVERFKTRVEDYDRVRMRKIAYL